MSVSITRTLVAHLRQAADRLAELDCILQSDPRPLIGEVDSALEALIHDIESMRATLADLESI